MKKRVGKSSGILLQHLADLMEKWLRPTATPKKEICDQILLEQFLTDLEENTQRWLRCHCPKSSTEALQLAKDFNCDQEELVRDKGPRMGEATCPQEPEHWGEQEKKVTVVPTARNNVFTEGRWDM